MSGVEGLDAMLRCRKSRVEGRMRGPGVTRVAPGRSKARRGSASDFAAIRGLVSRDDESLDHLPLSAPAHHESRHVPKVALVLDRVGALRANRGVSPTNAGTHFAPCRLMSAASSIARMRSRLCDEMRTHHRSGLPLQHCQFHHSFSIARLVDELRGAFQICLPHLFDSPEFEALRYISAEHR
jgi:hypothetical protein